jgi:integrase
MALDERSVAAALPAQADGESRAKFYLDTKQIGFGLAVSAKGAKSYFVLRSTNGRQTRFVFGRYDEITVGEARAKARKLLAQMTLGVNPQAERQAARAAERRAKVRGFTLGDAWALYKGTLVAKGRSAVTVNGYDYALSTYLHDWLDRPLGAITRAEVRARHRQIADEVGRGKYIKRSKFHKNHRRGEASGKGTANGVMRAFRAVWNRALREHQDLPISPTVNIDWFPEQRRTTVIAADGMKKWYAEVMALTSPVRRDYLRFVLFTGLRRTSAAEVRWEHVDLEKRLLHVPRPKGGKAFDLPLSNYLVELLKARRKENEILFLESAFVFPATKSKTGHISEPRDTSGGNYTIHDLRRTFITVAESLDVSPYAIKLLVNHALPKADVTGGYVVPELERLRPVMQQITDHLRRLCEGTPAKAAAIGGRKKKADVRA